MLTVGEGKELIVLCRSGKLYEVSDWITAGRSLQVPADLKKTPLQVAVGLGFHSLVKLLAIHELNQPVKNLALSDAVRQRSVGLVELLIEHGAEPSSIALDNVLLTWEPTLIRLFLRSGCDALTGHPFTIGFCEKVRTSLRPFMEYRDAHPELADGLQQQLDRALRYFCREGDLKWVSLLMWVGANPRSVGPVFLNESAPDMDGTALQEAAGLSRIDILKRLKPDPGKDDFGALVSQAAMSPATEVLQYLLQAGAQPNDKPNGGSSAFDRCFVYMHLEGLFPSRFGGSKGAYAVRNSLENFRVLAQYGSLWKPDERTSMNSARRTLLECAPEVSMKLLELLITHKACSAETLQDLFSSPAFRKHLIGEHWKLSRLKLREMATVPVSVKKARLATFQRSTELMRRYDREKLYEQGMGTAYADCGEGIRNLRCGASQNLPKACRSCSWTRLLGQESGGCRNTQKTFSA